MSAIHTKSLTGITSITTPPGVDNVFTVHSNDTTERFRVDSNGNQVIAGILTVAQDLDVDGHTNLDNLSVAGVSTFAGDLTISSSLPRITLNDTNHESDFDIKNENGSFRIRDLDNPTDRYRINSSGTIHEFFGAADFNSHLTVDGIITANGNIDANGDLDVDGHTNLDNVSVAGVTTMGQTTIAHTSAPQLIIKDSDTTGAADSNGISFQDASNTQYGFIGQTSSGGHTMLITTTNTVNPIRLQVNSSTKLEAGNTGVYVQNGNFYVLDGYSSNISGDVNLNSNAPTVNFNDSNANPDYKVFVNTGVFKITDTTNNVDRITIATDGNISITNDLDVDGHTNLDNVSIAGVSTNASTTYFDNQVYWRNGGSNKMFTLSNNAGMNWQDDVKAEFGNSGDLKIYNVSSENHIYGATSQPIIFSTNTNERLRIKSTGDSYFLGNLGIGTAVTTPATTLHLDSTGTPTTIQIDSDTESSIDFNDHGGSAKRYKIGTNISDNNGQFEIKDMTANAERIRITSGGVVQIGGAVENNADIDTSNTKLTIKQSANSKEDGIYLERSGERRGWYMFVGGSYGFNDAFCLSTNQMGTKTDVLSIDRGNRLAKIGGDVIIDSSNNGYGGLRIYDDSSGDYNVRYITGRNQGLTAHVFERGGRTQNQSPWTNATSSEIARLTHTNGISFRGEGTTNIGSYASHHLRVKTNDKERIHIDNRGVLTAPKLNTKALVFSSCTNKWASQRGVLRFYMDFYTGASSATYHFMRMISQPDWAFDDVTIKQIRYQYNPDGGDHATRRYYTYYGSHTEQIINYNQQGGGSGTNASNYITKRTDFGPGGAFKIHEAANGGYYRDLYGSDYSIGLSNYLGVRLEITVYNTVGVYDTGTYATASDFYPAAFGGQATQSDADSWSGPRGVWFNTTSNGTGSGTAPVVAIHKNTATGWSTGSNFLDTSA